ncbi:MAG: hypothetical protein BWK73_05805 [Thiothrix lacustris]|uniref:Uncharacterized protein n=1 Tax=Thiothrix lacustris TaxID=525917 RepID=A0A1Y1QWX2_9GAMM|nr:MAG: hypothetical protein BWK73_05805 [Thiothrix lacustris]
MIPYFSERKHFLEKAIETAKSLDSQIKTLGIEQPEIKALRLAMEAEAASLGATIEERKATTKRYTSAYVKRAMDDIPREIEALNKQIMGGIKVVSEKREALSKANIPSGEITRLLPDFDLEPLQGRIAELRRELSQWHYFNRTGLPEDLPETANA